LMVALRGACLRACRGRVSGQATSYNWGGFFVSPGEWVERPPDPLPGPRKGILLMSGRSPASSGPWSADNTALAHLRHELRTPLNAVIGYSEIILEAAADVLPEVHEGLQLIHRCGTLLLQLVNDGLDPSRLADAPFEVRAILLCEGMGVHLATTL